MRFKNINTGLIWRITDKEHKKRLVNDKNYEQVNVATENNTTDNTLTDYSAMKWQELRSLATDKGINTHGKKRDEIEKRLSELGDVDA